MQEERGLDPTHLARLARLSPATVSRLRSGQRRARQTTLDALERAAGIPLPPELRMTGTSLTEPRLADDLLPVYALVGAGVRGTYYRNTAGADSIRRPPGVQHNRMAYAVRMPDDTMAPWRRPNELVFIDPTLFAAAGDHALVELNHPTDPNHAQPLFQIRHYLGRTRSGYRLAQHSPAGEEIVPIPGIAKVLRVLEWPEVVGLR